uniref:Uncharacterized protein n=2 Tax=viral metagenome TaxID=1070528 RepID=A0A6M3IY72_9ZZZZ
MSNEFSEGLVVTGDVDISTGSHFKINGVNLAISDLGSVGALASLNTVDTDQIDNDAITAAKLDDSADFVMNTLQLAGNIIKNSAAETTITLDVDQGVTFAANVVVTGSITSGTWAATAIAVTKGGTGATSAADARTNLGLAIGTNVQAYNATLAAVAAGTYAGDDSIVTVGTITAGVWNGTDVAVTAGGTGAGDASTARTNLGLAIGTNVQAYNSNLATLATSTGTAGYVWSTDGAGTGSWTAAGVYTAGTGLDLTTGTFSLSHLGLENLTDPGEDRLIGWDDTAGNTLFFKLGANISITGDTINAVASGGSTTWNLDGDSGTPEIIEDAQTVTFAGGAGIDTVVSSGDVLTISIDATVLVDGDFTSDGLMKRTGAGTYGIVTDSSTDWNTAYSDRMKWDGGDTGLTAATGRTSLDLANTHTHAPAALGSNNQIWGSNGSANAWKTPKKKSIILTALGGTPNTTTPCADPEQKESTTNDVNYWVLAFDQTSDEYASWDFALPADYDGGTFDVTFYWTAESGSNDVSWNIKAQAQGNDDAIDGAWGTAQEAEDTLITAGDVHIVSTGTPLTAANTPVAGDDLKITVWRDADGVVSNLAADALLLKVRLDYTPLAY